MASIEGTLRAYVKRVGPEISEIKSQFSSVDTRRVGAVGLAT